MSALRQVDLTNCDREPIHIPGTIQAHGFLLAVTAGAHDQLRVAIASENATFYLQRPLQAILDADLWVLLGSNLKDSFTEGLLSETKGGDFARFLGTTEFDSSDGARHKFQVVGYRVHGLIVLEFELNEHSASQGKLNAGIATFVATLEEVRDPHTLCQAVTSQIRELTGYDRILLYRFDEQEHGRVLAEDRNDRLPSYLGLQFPGTDIPKQARELYLQNRIRIIPDVEYQPSPLMAATSWESAPPLDLSLSILRSVSPVHRDYMRNMGTASSMSISIVSRGKLWGLISGHHAEPRSVPFLVRSACDVLSRIVASQLLAFQNEGAMADAVRFKTVQSRLLTTMTAAESYTDALRDHPQELCAVTDASGAALLVDDLCLLLGKTPAEADVRQLGKWLSERAGEEIFATHNLASVFDAGEDLWTEASGVLGVSLSQVHHLQILWFRPEVIETVHWAGEPTKEQENVAGILELSPRNSFSSWKEIVRGHSHAWSLTEIESARDFRNAVLEIVLKRAEELADLVAELKTTNAELEAFSYSVSHDLRAPFRHISGFAELLTTNEAARLSDTGRRHLATIAESAQFAGLLVDSLLNFAHIARTKLDLHQISMTSLVESVWANVRNEELKDRSAAFHVAELPTACVDINLMRQVWRNLLSNAVKYTRQQEQADIIVTVSRESGEYIFSVQDNGVGFDNRYAHKLFGAFQRLHRMEEFEGTGVGLANVRRIVARHGGKTWAEGKEGRGATFFFSLPIPGAKAFSSTVQ